MVSKGRVYGMQLNWADMVGSTLQVTITVTDGSSDDFNVFNRGGTPDTIVSAWAVIATTAFINKLEVSVAYDPTDPARPLIDWIQFQEPPSTP